jgi:hypothetical protein
VALAGVTCAFPTDKSDKVFVTLESPSHVVLRGQEMSIYARAWRVTGSDTQPIANVDFSFTSGSSTIARVDKDCCGYATVTGVNSGTVDILARAVAFEQAGQADLALRVSNPLEIDSVRPATAHYGEILTVYGVGVDSMFLASLNGVNLIEYPFSRVRDSATGLGRISFWVPPPAQSAPLFFLGAGVFGLDTGVTNVLKDDVFEPNDTIASLIDLDVSGPWPGTVLAPIIFTNPALAFEPIDRTLGLGQDWFQFNTIDSTQPLTFFITYPSFGDTSAAATRTFFLDSLYYNTGGPGDPIEKFFGRDSADFISSDFYRCKGDVFRPTQLQRESTTVALKTLPSHRLHVVTFFSRVQRYGLTVARGYFTADPRIAPDRFEENDLCHYTDSIPGKPSPASRIRVSTTAMSDTANIDNPFEIDWYRIEVPAMGVGDSILFRIQSRPFVAGRDSSDIDIYVLTVPGSTGSGVAVVGSSVKGGSTENLTLALGAGSYYVAVVDYAGVAIRYSMCMRRVPAGGLSICPLIAPGPATPGAPKRQRQPAGAAPARAGTAAPLFGPVPRP